MLSDRNISREHDVEKLYNMPFSTIECIQQYKYTYDVYDH